jgi:hypothetical protein
MCLLKTMRLRMTKMMEGPIPLQLTYCFIFVVSTPLCYINYRSYILSNTTRWILIPLIHTFIQVTCFGHVIAIITPDVNCHRTTQHNANSIMWSVSDFIVFYIVLWCITVYQIPVFYHKFYINFNDRCEQQVLILESAASSASSTVKVGLMMAMT